MVAIGRRLRSAGHDVILAGPPNFSGQAEGLDFRVVGQDIEQLLVKNAGEVRAFPSARTLFRLVQEEMTEQFTFFTSVMPEVDLVVGASVQFTALSAAQAVGRTYIHVVYCPQLLESISYPPPMVPFHGLPHWCNRLGWKFWGRTIDRYLRPHLNELRAKSGIPPLTDAYAHFRDTPMLVASDALISPVPQDILSPVVQTGAWVLEDQGDLDTDLKAFLDAGPAPVYIGFGSMPDRNPTRTTRLIVKAAQRAGVRLVLSRGWAGLGSGDLPDTVKVVGPTAHAKLFPRVSAVVHHGGAGTTAAAARAGVPQVAVPHFGDQFYFSYRLPRLGLGPQGISRIFLSESWLAEALQAMQESPMRERAGRMGEELRATDGLGDGVKAIAKDV